MSEFERLLAADQNKVQAAAADAAWRRKYLIRVGATLECGRYLSPGEKGDLASFLEAAKRFRLTEQAVWWLRHPTYDQVVVRRRNAEPAQSSSPAPSEPGPEPKIGLFRGRTAHDAWEKQHHNLIAWKKRNSPDALASQGAQVAQSLWGSSGKQATVLVFSYSDAMPLDGGEWRYDDHYLEVDAENKMLLGFIDWSGQRQFPFDGGHEWFGCSNLAEVLMRELRRLREHS